MTQKLKTTNDIKNAFTTDLNHTEKQLMQYINEMQPVCRKIICLNVSSVSKSTIQKNIRKLIDKDILEENEHKSLTLTRKGQNLL